MSPAPTATFVVTSLEPLPDYPRRLGDAASPLGARGAEGRVFLAERERQPSLARTLNYAQTLDAVERVATTLLRFDLSPERPLFVLFGLPASNTL